MKLLIEHGQLLKPYAAPYDPKTKSHRKPAGWTPDRTPAMRASHAVLKVIHPDAGSHVIWEQIETDEAERLRGKPWPGWVPVVYARGGIDQEIGGAYKRLYLKMNEKRAEALRMGLSFEYPVKWPRDGGYIYEDGEMAAIPYHLRETV